MAAAIVVTPERLLSAAVAARALGGRLLGVRGRLTASLGAVDAALGDGEAQAAFAWLWARWSGSVERLEAVVHDLAAALEAAAEAYERADRQGTGVPGTAVMPPVAARPPGTPGLPRVVGEGPAGGGGAHATPR
jgi:WXG100 family type VII secretion target